MTTSKTRQQIERRPPLAEPYSLSLRFGDVDEFVEGVQGWNIDFRQLDRGKLSGELLQAGGPKGHVAYVDMSRRMEQHGGAPPGLRTFAFLEERTVGVRWCGRPVTPQSILVFKPNGEFEATSAPGFSVYTMSFPEESLQRLCDEAGLPGIEELLGETEKTPVCEAHSVERLRESLRDLFGGLRREPRCRNDSSRPCELTSEIPRRLLFALASGRIVEQDTQPQARSRALARAEDFIAGFGQHPITVWQLCEAADVSERTLQRAFSEHFGVTPKAYLLARQLNGVHRELKGADPAVTRVTDVAHRWGFWHMGQFAADYRRQFGELPSDTLQRGARS